MFAYAEEMELVYSQNNPPSQSTAHCYIAKDYPILINADLLTGYVFGQPTNAFLQTIATGLETSYRTFNFDSDLQAGFRAGFGFGLKNDFNLSSQYTRHSSHKIKQFSLSNANQVITVLELPVGAFSSLPSGHDATLTLRRDVRYQTLDLLLQTAAWMLNSNLRFQPFGGLRYFHFTNKMETFTQDTTDESRFASTRNSIRIRSTGVLIGTDIKYMIAKHFHFYSNALVAILAGHQKRDYVGNTNLTLEGLSFDEHERFPISMNPQVELRFGFAWEHVFSNQLLLSMRVGYELSSLIQTSAVAISPAPTIISQGPLRSNNVIKTQLIVVGTTLGF
jgi:hypothetical protein